MAYLIGETSATRSSGQNLEKNGLLWRVKRTFTREFLVLADTLDEPDASIRSAVPQLGSVLGTCVCKDVSISEVDTVIHPKTGKLTAQYRIVCMFDNDVRLDPLAMDAEVRWSSELEEVPLYRDVDTGAPIQTACGERIPLTTQRTIPILDIRRFSTFPFDPDIILEYTNTLNSTEFWGAPAGHALLANIECDYTDVEITDEIKMKFALVSYHIKFRFTTQTETPWKAEPLHYGNYEWADGEKTAITQHIDKEGRPCQTLLSEDGFDLGPSEDPIFLSFNQYPTTDWTSLNIDRTQLGY